jgi:arylamine N-acetyltransferase
VRSLHWITFVCLWKPISLKNKEILEGFRSGKGGICYQSNGAFRKLLFLLDFAANLVGVTMFRFGRDEPKPYADMRQDVHCAILVTLAEKEYLVDLVWGNAFRYPLPIGDVVTQVEGEDMRQCVKEGDLYQLKVYFDDKWEVEYHFKNEKKKKRDFRKDVEFICSNQHHLSRTLLLMKPLKNGEFEYLAQEIYKENNGSLFFNRKSPNQQKTQKIEITSRAYADEKLKGFGVSEDNRKEILNICKLQS